MLHLAAENEDFILLKYSMRRITRPRLAVNLKRGGLTPLHLSASKGSLQFMQFFIRIGAEVNAQSNIGRSALHYAVFNKHFEAVKLLISKNANVNIEDKEKLTPLHLAVCYGTEEIADLLLKNGANIDAQTNKFRTPLHLAVLSLKEDIVKRVLESNPDVSLQDDDGWTALHIATRIGATGMVQCLLKHETSNIDAKNNFGKTALHISANYGIFEIVQLLVEYKCDIYAKEKHNKTAIDFAFGCAPNHHLIAKFLKEKMLNKTIDTKVNDNASNCNVCHEPRNGTFAFVPCGHSFSCEQCCLKILKMSPTERNCPCCRSTVERYIQIRDVETQYIKKCFKCFQPKDETYALLPCGHAIYCKNCLSEKTYCIGCRFDNETKRIESYCRIYIL